MGKRGRTSTEDLDILNGLADGEIEGDGYTRTIKGNKMTEVFNKPGDKFTIISEKDPSLPPHVNGGWRMKSLENDKVSTTNEKVSEEKDEGEFDEKENALLPKTKRKYFNGKKWVGYTRAKNLGLID
jgi:hypothetical protein